MNILTPTKQNLPSRSTALKQEQTRMMGANSTDENPSAPLISEVRISSVQKVKLLTMETVAEAWKEMENWHPSKNKTPTENVEQLRELYSALKSYILESVDEESQAFQLAKLESLVMEHVDELLNSHYGALLDFFRNNNQEAAITMIRYSLFFFITGKISEENLVWPEELYLLLFNQNEHTSASQSTERGMVHYGPGRKTQTHISNSQPQSVLNADRGSARSKTSDGFSGVIINCTEQNNTLKSLFPKPFTLVELEKSNAFAQHMSRHSSSLPSLTANPENQGFLGIATGVTWLKGQAFAKVPGVNKNLAQVMQNTVEHQIFTCLSQASATSRIASDYSSANAKPPAVPEQNIAFPVYHYLVRSFVKNNDPKSAILDSIFYLLELSINQEKDPAHKESRISLNIADEFMDDNKNWLQQMKNSWNQFIKDMNLRTNARLDFSRFPELYSLWASSLSPIQRPSQAPEAANSMPDWRGITVPMTCAALLVLGAISYFFLFHSPF